MILVTGAQGFMGRCVCSVLSAQGKDVVGLDRRGLDSLDSTPSYPLVQCDVRDAAQVRDLLLEYALDAVVHLASLLRTASQRNPLEALRVNVQGSLNLMEAARAFGVRRFVYASSLSAYGSVSGARATAETDPATPDDIYGATKRCVEVLGETYRRQFGLQFTALRIANVVGAGARSRTSPWRSEIFEKMGSPHTVEVVIPYMGNVALPLIHVDDVADMLEYLVDAERMSSHTVYNAPAETWNLSDLAAYINSLDGNLRIIFGESTAGGTPRVVDSGRFTTEFRYAPVPLAERLRHAARSCATWAHCGRGTE